MLNLQGLCVIKIIKDEVLTNDLPQILYMDLKYYPLIRYNKEVYQVFEHVPFWVTEIFNDIKEILARQRQEVSVRYVCRTFRTFRYG